MIAGIGDELVAAGIDGDAEGEVEAAAERDDRWRRASGAADLVHLQYETNRALRAATTQCLDVYPLLERLAFPLAQSRRRDRGSVEDKGCTTKIASCCQTFTQRP